MLSLSFSFIFIHFPSFSFLNPSNLLRLVSMRTHSVSVCTMLLSIAAVLRRGEKLEDMVERSENIAIEANQFKRSAVQLKKTMWWKNFKLWLIIIAVIIIIIIIIIIATCGINFKCKK